MVCSIQFNEIRSMYIGCACMGAHAQGGDVYS